MRFAEKHDPVTETRQSPQPLWCLPSGQALPSEQLMSPWPDWTGGVPLCHMVAPSPLGLIVTPPFHSKGSRLPHMEKVSKIHICYIVYMTSYCPFAYASLHAEGHYANLVWNAYAKLFTTIQVLYMTSGIPRWFSQTFFIWALQLTQSLSGSDVALVWPWCGRGVALMWPWCGPDLALMWPWCGTDLALIWPWCDQS